MPSIWLTLFILQGIAGLGMFEWAYNRLSRARDVDEARDSSFQAWRRLDVQKWSRVRLWPGAFCLLNFRMFIILGSIFVMAVFHWLLYRGIAGGWKTQLTGWRYTLFRISYWWVTTNLLYAFGYSRTEVERTDVDYSYYLGPNWRKEYKAPKHISTVTSNHVAFLDIVQLLNSRFFPSFVAAGFLETIGLSRFYCDMLQCIYFHRVPGTKSGSDEVLESMVARQGVIENSDIRLNPIAIFPEGSVTNGSSLLKFRKGAFVGLKTIQPVILKYNWEMISPAYDVARGVDLGFLMLSYFGTTLNSAETQILPPFQPNEYLFKTHADKGKEKWEIFCWALEDVYIKNGGFQRNEQALREKVAYQEFIWKLRDEVSTNGKTFYYPSRAKAD